MKGFKDKSNQCELELSLFFFLFSLITLDDCSFLFFSLVFDFAILASALILDVTPLAFCLPERGQMQSVVPGCVRNAAFHSKTVQQGESLNSGLSPPTLLLGLVRRERESGEVVVFLSILYITMLQQAQSKVSVIFTDEA